MPFAIKGMQGCIPMDISISAISLRYQYEAYAIQTFDRTAADGQNAAKPTSMLNMPQDIVDFGKSRAFSAQDAIRIVNERMMEKLRGVVEGAQQALGMNGMAMIDTSAEATAGRIADFALGFFEAWRKNHADLGDDDARKQFASFIGAAIKQGIDEASGILTALNALTPQNTSLIQNIASIVQQRLDDFVSGNADPATRSNGKIMAA